jgi:hypothetical protein
MYVYWTYRFFQSIQSAPTKLLPINYLSFSTESQHDYGVFRVESFL